MKQFLNFSKRVEGLRLNEFIVTSCTTFAPFKRYIIFQKPSDGKFIVTYSTHFNVLKNNGFDVYSCSIAPFKSHTITVGMYHSKLPKKGKKSVFGIKSLGIKSLSFDVIGAITDYFETSQDVFSFMLTSKYFNDFLKSNHFWGCENVLFVQKHVLKDVVKDVYYFVRKLKIDFNHEKGKNIKIFKTCPRLIELICNESMTVDEYRHIRPHLLTKLDVLKIDLDDFFGVPLSINTINTINIFEKLNKLEELSFSDYNVIGKFDLNKLKKIVMGSESRRYLVIIKKTHKEQLDSFKQYIFPHSTKPLKKLKSLELNLVLFHRNTNEMEFNDDLQKNALKRTQTEIENFLNLIPNVEILKLTFPKYLKIWHKSFYFPLIHLLSNLKRLKRLDYLGEDNFTDYEKTNSTKLIKLSESFKNLIHLNLPHCERVRGMLFSQCRHLKTLKIKPHPYLNDIAFSGLINLTELFFYGKYFYDEEDDEDDEESFMDELLNLTNKAFENLHKLKILRLGSYRNVNSEITDSGLKHLINLEKFFMGETTKLNGDCLKKMTKLKTLDIGYNKIEEKKLTHLKNLKSLLRNNDQILKFGSLSFNPNSSSPLTYIFM